MGFSVYGAVVEMGILNTLKRLLMESRGEGAGLNNPSSESEILKMCDCLMGSEEKILKQNSTQ
jgi:hypothetical protein